MTYERIKRPSSGKPESQDAPSRFAPRPFTIQPQQDVERTATQEGKDQNAKIPESDILPQGILSRHAIRPKLPGIQMKKLDFKWTGEQVQQSEPADIQHKEMPQQKVETPKKPETQPTPSPEQKTVPGDTKAPEATKEKKSSSGIAAKSLTDAFGKEAYNFWKDPGNQEKPMTDLVDFLMAKVNEKLPYPCEHRYTTSGSIGAFEFESCIIYFNTNEFSDKPQASKISDISEDRAADIIDTTCHESRHFEQVFRLAQMQAGQGKTAEDIDAEMSIPLAVVEAAMKSPLAGDTEANKELIAEAQGWEKFFYGKYAAYRSEVNAMLLLIEILKNKLEARFEQTEDEQEIDTKQTGNESKTEPDKTEDKSKTEPDKTEDESKTDADSKQLMADFEILSIKIGNQLHNYFDKLVVEIKNSRQMDKDDQRILDNIQSIKSAHDKLKTAIDEQKSDPDDYDVNRPGVLISILRAMVFYAYQDIEIESDAIEVGEAAKRTFYQQRYIQK
ncbi:hypothetical protein NIES4074_27810 [Cylindrospermum sp. NIES-4074]|nr:hypothetical protein NIES4074_27810 [Cylindrospermum sp. NIES-4074]